MYQDKQLKKAIKEFRHQFGDIKYKRIEMSRGEIKIFYNMYKDGSTFYYEWCFDYQYYNNASEWGNYQTSNELKH